MTFRARTVVFLVSTPLVILVVVGGLLGAARTPQRGVPHLSVFYDVESLIRRAYVEEVNIDRVMDGAMRGLIDGLDASSAFLAPDEVRAISANAPLPTGDVGLTVTRQFYLRVLGVRDGSPAERAGLATGDFVRAIGDIPARDMSALAGARLLRGAPGTKVSLVVLRGNAADPHVVELVREIPKVQLATGKRLPGGEAYLRVSSFTPETVAAIRAQLQVTPGSSQPAQIPAAAGVIIDLRGTSDGTPADGIAAARLFVKSGTLATRAGRSGEKDVTIAQTGDGALTMPVVLLVSHGTAHAAEVFTSALAANKRATMVGEPTAGLAALQRLVALPDGYGLWMTYSRYLQGDATPIHERGLTPDIVVEMPVVAFGEQPLTIDAGLNRAVEELQKMHSAK